MYTKNQKFAALFMAVIMFVSMLPIQAFAATDAPFTVSTGTVRTSTKGIGNMIERIDCFVFGGTAVSFPLMREICLSILSSPVFSSRSFHCSPRISPRRIPVDSSSKKSS